MFICGVNNIALIFESIIIPIATNNNQGQGLFHTIKVKLEFINIASLGANFPAKL